VAPWVRAWLWAVAALVVAMVVVGGATRLTGSGLSITRWNLVMGALPPLSQADWAADFARYQASPQYHLLNQGMSLDAFKSIYWWEWSHRQLGRFIGLVYIAGFVWGLVTHAFPRREGWLLAGMGVLLGFQGLVGWIMVASGLKAGMTAVEPVDLAAHLLFASLFLASVVAMATRLGRAGAPVAAAGGVLPKALLVAVLVQLVLGALTAGSHAGLVYNTWPTMDGNLAPPAAELFAATPWWENFVDNVTLIQFDHRMMAYLVLALALWTTGRVARRSPDPSARRLAWLLAVLVVGQVALGITTLVLAVPLHAALAHQFVAMLVLIATTRLATLDGRPAPAPAVAVASGPLAAHGATR
jgi:cytochrome c oxidase assembly protein subunit 15